MAAFRRIDEFRGRQRVQAGSLIVSLFGDAALPRGGRIWLGSLIRLLEPLGVNERLVRTSVFRLVKERWLRSETLGRRADYLLTDAGRRRFDAASAQIYSSRAPDWDRRWRLILLLGPLDTRERERLRRALAWQGYGAVGGECFVHPRADLAATLDALAGDGLEAQLECLMPLLAADAGAGMASGHAELVARAWNLDAIGHAYQAFVDAYEPALRDLRGARRDELADETAFLMRLLLIHDYRRLFLRDPELPEALLPEAWPGRRARQLCREIYRRLLVPSERHLDAQFQLADGRRTRSDESLDARFPAEDPLQGIDAPVATARLPAT
ncbi:MAG TPA: phenylacetic acid degradation operon negative regulatory protein PaaX [Burkholderiaceae bacterium]|nr:phenylacetic acid degradation operon negative regulatory protein PaaX [Burkholderiaceae bacterium]